MKDNQKHGLVWRRVGTDEARRIASSLTAIGQKPVQVDEHTEELQLIDWLFHERRVCGILRAVRRDDGTESYFYRDVDPSEPSI